MSLSGLGCAKTPALAAHDADADEVRVSIAWICFVRRPLIRLRSDWSIGGVLGCALELQCRSYRRDSDLAIAAIKTWLQPAAVSLALDNIVLGHLFFSSYLVLT
jgi:hypothetical protein